MIKRIIGGVVTLIIGGSTFAVSQSDVVKNFSQETGMTQEQAQQYVKDTKTVSWKEVGTSFVNDGTAAMNQVNQMDCTAYTYAWETPSLTCADGKSQLQAIGTDEIALGNCYNALDSNLGSAVKSRMSECINDIDTVNADYKLPIATSLLDSSTLTDANNTNAYNKSVLKTALEAK